MRNAEFLRGSVDLVVPGRPDPPQDFTVIRMEALLLGNTQGECKCGAREVHART
jgi:hypothetical protein